MKLQQQIFQVARASFSSKAPRRLFYEGLVNVPFPTSFAALVRKRRFNPKHWDQLLSYGETHAKEIDYNSIIGVHRALQYFMHVKQEQLSESMVMNVIKLYLHHQDLNSAQTLLRQVLQAQPELKLRLRTISPLFVKLCNTSGNYTDLLELYRVAREHQIDLSHELFVQFIHKTLEYLTETEQHNPQAYAQYLVPILDHLRQTSHELAPSAAASLATSFEQHGFSVEYFTPSDNSSYSLEKFPPSKAAQNRMLEYTHTHLANLVSEELLDEFQRWILRSRTPKDRLHVLIDGPNIGYNLQNTVRNGHFRYDQVEHVVNFFQARGDLVSIIFPQSYLTANERFFMRPREKDSPNARLSQERQAQWETWQQFSLKRIAHWQEQNLIFSSPNGVVDDDSFGIYGSLLLNTHNANGRMLTRDQLRDHLARFHENGVSTVELERWKENTLIYYGFMPPAAHSTRELQAKIFFPKPYTTTIQYQAPNAQEFQLQIPIQSREHWLACHRHFQSCQESF